MNIFTDEDIKEIVGPWGDTPIKGYTRSLFDKIEAKLREKRAAPQPDASSDYERGFIEGMQKQMQSSVDKAVNRMAALAEPQPEPVAWMVYTEGGTSAYVTDNPNDLVGAYRALPLYTTPPQRQQLTDWEAVAADQAMTIAMLRSVEAERDALLGILKDALSDAEWSEKIIYPFVGEDFQSWRLTVFLGVPLSESDKSPEAALERTISAAIDAARSKT